jgi:cytochrome c peroxidase
MHKGQHVPSIAFARAATMVAAATAVATTGLTFLLSAAQPVRAQTASRADAPDVPRFARPMIDHMQKMRRFRDAGGGGPAVPPEVIPRFGVDDDPTGKVATFQPNGATFTNQNAFFKDMGTNGRTCFTCHLPQEGWGLSAANAAARFNATGGTDPLFRLVDGSTCPTDKVATLQQRRRAYKLATDKGLIRIGLPVPPNAEYSIVAVDDPYNCNTNPETGLTSPTSGITSTYRRPLPSTNLGFISGIMWDGREPSLQSQAIDATLGHAQADAAPTAEQVAQIVAFETGIFTAQMFDNKAGLLSDDGAKGGPITLQLELANFFIGINDPIGLNPRGIPFTNVIFDLYRPWLGTRGRGDDDERRRSIARGQDVFNNTQINISGVRGLNDVLGVPNVPGFCGTCHDTPNVGNHSIAFPIDIGISDPPDTAQPALDVEDLPVFTLQCNSGPLAGQTFRTTDAGRAQITGKCEDIGKFKGPILRALASRAPFFHNGSAETLQDAVDFYDQRFNIGLTDRQKADLVNFLNAL